MLAACALTCSPTVCPAAGLLVSPGRGGAGVGRIRLVLSTLWFWPVFVVVRAALCRDAMAQYPRIWG